MDISSLFYYFPTAVSEALAAFKEQSEEIREIRLRAGAPAVLLADKLYHLTNEPVSADNIQRTAQRMCQDSVYARQAELRQGFVTLPGGHRAGFCGRTVQDGETIRCLTDISSIHLRITHEVIGAADAVLPFIVQGNEITNTLVVSPPGHGKTTMLRDIARHLAGEAYGFTVGIADERGEIAAMHRGTPQHDVGIYADVYDGCPKAQAMQMLLRGMSPQVVITDELGGEADCRAVEALAYSGVRVICSAHGRDKKDVLLRSDVGQLLRAGIFEKVITLTGIGQVASIL